MTVDPDPETVAKLALALADADITDVCWVLMETEQSVRDYLVDEGWPPRDATSFARRFAEDVWHLLPAARHPH